MKPKLITLKEWVVLTMILVAVAFVASEAHATPPNKDSWRPDKHVPPKLIVNKNTVDKSITNEASATSVSSANNDLSVATDVSVQGATIPDDMTIRNTAPGIAPSVYPSGNCYMGWSLGFGLPGFNASGGKAKLDENCDARETARMFYQFGERDKAIRILCAQPAAAILDECRPDEDYHREIAKLKAQNELLLEDNGRLSNQVRAYCKESADRSLKACAK